MLEESIDQLALCYGTGGYFANAAVYSEDEDLTKRIAMLISSSLSGSKTQFSPFKMVTYNKGDYSDFQLIYNVPTHEVVPGSTLLNSEQAGMFLMLPATDLPGLELKKNVFYGRPVSANVGADLGRQAFHSAGYKITYQDLCSHILVTGTTGSGKTIRSAHLLNDLPRKEFNILCLETAKKTYAHKLCRGDEDDGYSKVVYTLGNSSGNPLRINPFYFEEGTSLKRHISVLSEALSELLPMEALIGPKLREAVMNIYFRYDWDIELGEYSGKGKARYPTVIDFNEEIATICENLNYSAELNQNYRGALEGRAKLFIDDLYQDIFAFDGNRNIDEILKEDTIIEMEELPPSEINMPAFIISILLERIRAHKAKINKLKDKGKVPFTERKLLIVIEEAHNVLHRKHEEEKGQRETSGGKHLIDQIIRLLQEGRELEIGVVVIDQSASSLSQAVIQNTNNCDCFGYRFHKYRTPTPR